MQAIQVDFYHLTRSSVEEALPQIAGKVLGAGARLLVVSADEAQRRKFDAALWDQPGFLAHGEAGGEDDARQPILISSDCAAPNAAAMVALADGQWRDEALKFERAFLFFGDEARLAAREAWASLKDREAIERRYFFQQSGRWKQEG